MCVALRDGVARLYDLPFFILYAHGALDQHVTAPFETAQSPRRAQSVELPSANLSGRTGSDQAGARSDGAVAINAIDFHRGAWFAVNFSIAVIVLAEVAIGALHPFFQVDIRKVDGFAKPFRVVKRDLLAVLVEPVAFAIVRVYSAIDPAMPVEIRKLRGFQLLVEFLTASLLQKFFIAPQSARGGGFWIFQRGSVAFFFSGIFLCGGIHFFAVDFIVPPRQTEISGEHVRSRMHVADHALAGGNRARENVFDGMAGLRFVDSRIDARTIAG